MRPRFSVLGCSLLFAMVFFTPQNLFSQENYTTWAHSQNIIINTAADGYNIASTITNFPYLVRLSKKSFDFGQTGGQGADIRFANSAGTHLSYEIELWDSANGKAALWVKVDRILGNNSTQYIVMYWGRTGVTSQSSGPAVFDTANGFAGVWHMDERPSGSGSIRDRTSNVLNGTPTSSMDATRSMDGVVGRSLQFNGADDYITLPTVRTSFTGGLTVSGWMKYSALNSWSRLIDFGNGAGNNNILIGNLAGSEGLRWEMWNAGTANTIDIQTYFVVDEWIYVTGVYTGSNSIVYRNETEVGRGAAANALININRTQCYIARSNWGGDALYAGQIDEVQISRVGRSADWVRLCYLNQKFMVEDPPTISYANKDIIIIINSLIDPVVPVISGIIDSITVTPALPDFLNFDKKTGAIVGWSTDPVARASYIVCAINSKGFSMDTISITIVPETSTGSGVLKYSVERAELLGISSGAQPTIVFSVPSPAKVREVRFCLYDSKGVSRWLSGLTAHQVRPGIQSITIAGPVCGSLAAGIYFVEMKVVGVQAKDCVTKRANAAFFSGGSR